MHRCFHKFWSSFLFLLSLIHKCMGRWMLFCCKGSEQGPSAMFLKCRHIFNVFMFFIFFITRWYIDIYSQYTQCVFIHKCTLHCVFIYCVVSILSHILIYFKTSPWNMTSRSFCCHLFWPTPKKLAVKKPCETPRSLVCRSKLCSLSQIEVDGECLDNIWSNYSDLTRPGPPKCS